MTPLYQKPKVSLHYAYAADAAEVTCDVTVVEL